MNDTEKQQHDDAIRALTMLREIVCRDMMPQIGGMVVQDYGQLNQGLLLATKVIGPYKGERFNRPKR